MNFKNLTILALIFLVVLASCDKDDDDNNNVDNLPKTYNFDNVSFSGQTDRLDMLAEMTSEMKKSNSGTSVDGAKLADMYANQNSPFSDANLNASTKDLKSKTYNSAGSYNTSSFEYLINYLATQSANAGNTWSPNNAGVATSGSKKYFFDPYGVEYTQIIEKGLMGAVFYYQAAENYTRDAKIGDSVDNETVVDGKGTDMEHHWDEAFGYLGVPTDLTVENFADKKAAGEVRYHGKYSEKGQKAGLNTTKNILDAFILGRYGISNKDYSKRDEAATKVREEWELIIATTAIHYLNSANENFSDDALRNHALSEAYAFIFSLSYNSDKKISNQDLSAAKDYFETTPPGSPSAVPYFLDVTAADITAARDIISAAYDLDNVKNTL